MQATKNPVSTWLKRDFHDWCAKGSGIGALAVVGSLLATILALASAHAHDGLLYFQTNKP